MAWTDNLTDVSWSNGDFLTELKLRQMSANHRWHRDQQIISGPITINDTEHHPIFTSSFPDRSKYWRLVVTGGGVAWTSANFTSGTYASMDSLNESLSGMSYGDDFTITFALYYSADGSSGWTQGSLSEYLTRKTKAIYTQAMAYMSHWVEVRVLDGTHDVDFKEIAQFRNASVVLHLDTQSW